MKSRELLTTHDLIASNYTITPLALGKYLHRFTPATTTTEYQFEANSTSVIEVGERYNVGYSVDELGRNIVEVSALSKSSQINPMISFIVAQQLAQQNYSVEKAKNDQRVIHSATDGYYWGKKYAWRMFGTVIPKGPFYKYLEEISHPMVPCITRDPDRSYSNDESVAYKEDGLQEAMTHLIESATKVSPIYFTSPLYTKRFAINGINSITDKK